MQDRLDRQGNLSRGMRTTGASGGRLRSAGRRAGNPHLRSCTPAALLLSLLLVGLGCVLEAPGEGASGASPVREAAAGAERLSPEQDPGPHSLSHELELRVMDVGQGDAVLLRSWTLADGERIAGRVALVDAGPANRIVGQLRALGVDTIDLLVASHNHADHIGGMDAILDSIPVRFYLDNGHPATTRIQQRVLERVEVHGAGYLEASQRTISLGSTRLQVVPAPPDLGGDDQNNRSLTLVVEHGGFRALLPGDAETALLNALLAAGQIPRVDVLKAAHHGSRNGVTPGWLARTRPHVVAISVAARNQYGHPHAAALRYYCTGGRRVLRTDLHGDIVVMVDSVGEYAIRTARLVSADTSDVTPNACVDYSARDTAEVGSVAGTGVGAAP